YIDQQEEEDIQDIEAHLRGGIPNEDIDSLSDYWKVYPTIKNALFKESNRPHYSELYVELGKIKDTIFNHYEFTQFKNQVYAVFTQWKNNHEQPLSNLNHESIPKELIHTMSEDILNRFKNIPLINQYDMYQYVMG